MMHDACLDVFHTILGKLRARGKPAVLCQIVEFNVLVDGVMSSCLYKKLESAVFPFQVESLKME